MKICSLRTEKCSLLFSCLLRLFLPFALGMRSELRIAWLMKNCFFLAGETRLAGELGSDFEGSSIRLPRQDGV